MFGLAGMGRIPTSTPVIARETAETTAIAQASNTRVRLLKSGSQPRQVLRLQSIPRTKQTATATLDLNVDFSVDGQKNPQIDIPTATMDIEALVTKVEDNGDFHGEFVYTNTDVIPNSDTKPEDLEEMRSFVKKIAGSKTTFVTDDRGNVRKINNDISENLDAAIRQFLEKALNSVKEIPSILPQEAVGIGAQWQVINNITVNGINLRKVTTYELVDRTKDTVTLAANAEQTWDFSNMDMPKIPFGIEVEIISIDEKSSDKTQMELNQILPVYYNLVGNSDIKIKIINTNTSEEKIIDAKLSYTVDLESN